MLLTEYMFVEDHYVCLRLWRPLIGEAVWCKKLAWVGFIGVFNTVNALQDVARFGIPALR